MSLWLLTQAFQTGNPLREGLGRRGSDNCLPEHKTGDRAVKNNIGTQRDFPSTQGISTQSRGAAPTRTSLLGISNQKDQKHISKHQTTLICTTCCLRLGSSSHLCRGQTPRSCRLLHPTARENENGFAGTFASSSFFFFFSVCLGFFFLFHFMIILFFLFKYTAFPLEGEPLQNFTPLLRRHEASSRDPLDSAVSQSSSPLPSEPGAPHGL